MYSLNLFSVNFPPAARHEDTSSYLARWRDARLLDALHRTPAPGAPTFVLHDGPPYANGDLHLGHFLNKAVKDAVLKFKRLEGVFAPFVPGFDCHGLPVELEVEKLGVAKSDPQAFVEACRAYASEQATRQALQFEAFGVAADWQRPYRTMEPAFEAGAARLFASLPQRVRRLRPVHWCPACGSSLAEAEVEHRLRRSDSVEVRFAVNEAPGTHLLVWTTTPYTLPANEGVAFGPSLDYVRVQEAGLTLVRLRRETDGPDVESVPLGSMGWTLESPFTGRTVPLVAADYVTRSGTGLVHLAPSFGMDDFRVGEAHGLPVRAFVDGTGRFLAGLDGRNDWGTRLQGLTLAQGSVLVLELLGERVHRRETLEHDYPHCWRHKSPVFFKASEEWFLDLREVAPKALGVLEDVEFLPSTGRERLASMLRSRTSWCVSRSRLWGTPLVESEDDARRLDAVGERGLSAWHEGAPRRTLDVWFDSGVTHELVARARFGRRADLYVEGNDQHRGWFQSSLLTAVCAGREAPFRQVLTHGFVVDERGQKYSKSSGNYVPLARLLAEHGPDVLRVWALSQDVTRDVRMSQASVKQAAERLRRVRNTLRFCLQNLTDAPLAGGPVLKDPVLAGFARELEQLERSVRAAAHRYDFAQVWAELSVFCERASAELFTACKDTLYCDAPDAPLRRQTQALLGRLAGVLARVLVPLAPFSAEDAVCALGARMGDGRDGRADSAQWLTWSGLAPLEVAPCRGSLGWARDERARLHARFEAHREGRNAAAGFETLRQLGGLGVVLRPEAVEGNWPSDPTSLARLANYLGCAAVVLEPDGAQHCDDVEAGWRLRQGAQACPRCRRFALAYREPEALCERCEAVEAAVPQS